MENLFILNQLEWKNLNNRYFVSPVKHYFVGIHNLYQQ